MVELLVELKMEVVEMVKIILGTVIVVLLLLVLAAWLYAELKLLVFKAVVSVFFTGVILITGYVYVRNRQKK